MPAGSYVKRMPWGQQKPLLGYGIDWSHPLSRGIAGCWLFNEGAGNASNNLANNITNVVYGKGYVNNALYSDGSASYANLSNSSNLCPPELTLYYSGRYTNVLTSHACILERPYTSAVEPYYSFRLVMRVNKLIGGQVTLNNIRCVLDAEATSDLTNPYTPFNIAMTAKSGTQKLYLNTAIVATGGGVGNVSNFNTNITLGKSSLFPINIYPGLTDKLLIFSNALDTDAIVQLYAEPYCFIEGWDYGRSYSIPSSAFINSSFWYHQVLEAI